MRSKTPLEEFVAWWFTLSDTEHFLLFLSPPLAVLVMVGVVTWWKRRDRK